MKSFKLTCAGLFVGGSLCALVPTSALAARHNAATGPVVFGTVAVASENILTVTAVKGHPSVAYNGGTTFVPLSTLAQNNGLQVGDAIWATGTKSGSTLMATQITYDVVPFALPTKAKKFSGVYKSSTPTSVTLSSGKVTTFTVNASTTYRQNGKAVTAPKYHKRFRVVVIAGEYTDSSWVASSVRVWKA